MEYRLMSTCLPRCSFGQAVKFIEYDSSFSEDEKKQAKALKVACNLNNAACKLKLKQYNEAEKLCTKVIQGISSKQILEETIGVSNLLSNGCRCWNLRVQMLRLSTEGLKRISN